MARSRARCKRESGGATPGRPTLSRRRLLRENEVLRARLVECEEVLRAIRSGQVDALVVGGEGEPRVVPLTREPSAHPMLVEAMSQGAGILDERGTVLYCNSHLAEMLIAPLNRVMGHCLIDFAAVADREAVARMIELGRSENCSIDTSFSRGGSTMPVQLSLSPMRCGAMQSVCLVATDLTDRNLTLIDELTGLSNRRGFFTLAQQQLLVARRLKTEMILIFIDLDGFKPINDMLGHPAGDQALIDVAKVLKNTYRESDILARLGGDEFAVLAAGSVDMQMETLHQRLRDNLDAFNSFGNRPYQLAMSVGMVRCDHDEPLPLPDLLALADSAMYSEKLAHHRVSGQPAR
jgi:diguanylate cyclase (GGDEF)-like protein/PAS domain S-box-containing protein